MPTIPQGYCKPFTVKALDLWHDVRVKNNLHMHLHTYLHTLLQTRLHTNLHMYLYR